MYEAYKVAVRISLISDVARGLVNISRHLGHAHGQAANLNKELSKINGLLLKGGALMAAGGFGLGMVKSTLGPAKEYTHQLQLMNAAGMKHAEIVKATSAAWDATKIAPTSSVMENLASIRELRMVFGDTKHAIENVATVQKIQGVLATVRGDEGARSEAYELAKALEMKGAVRDPSEFNREADMITKAIVASGGKINATDFLGAFKYGRAATAGWNNDFTYTILPTLMQEMKSVRGSGAGAGGPGNALMSAYAEVVGGVITQRALGTWQKLGLMDPSKVVWSRDGHVKGVAPGGIKGSELFQHNPYEYAQKIILPALLSHGYTTPEQQRQVLQYLFPNRTAGFAMTQFVTQGWKFERDQNLIREAHGIDAYNQLLKNDPVMAEKALHAQWQSMLAIIGYQIMPTLVRWTLKLIGVLQSVANWVREHPKLVKVLMWALIGLSAALMFGGAVMMLSAAFRALGLVMAFSGAGGAGGIAALAGGFATLAGVLTKLIPIIGAVFVAWEAGQWIGNKIYNGMSDSQKNAMGRRIAQLMAALGSQEAKDALATEDSHIKPGGGGFRAPSTGNVYIDGRKVGQVVNEHNSRDANRYAGGSNYPDGSSHLTPVGAMW